MGVYIPNMEKPKNITRCSYKINPEECKCIYTGKVFEETIALISDHPCPDCPLIEIDLVMCEECEWSNGECTVGERYQGGCTFGERRADEHTDKRD